MINNSNLPNEYSAATVADLALELRIVSKLAWALTEQNQQLKARTQQQDQEISRLSLAKTTLEADVREATRAWRLSSLKYNNLFAAFEKPVEALDTTPRAKAALKRLKCKTIGDALVLDQSLLHPRTTRLQVLEALTLFLEKE